MNADECKSEPVRPNTTRSLFTVVVENANCVTARLRLSVGIAYLVALVLILWAWRASAGSLGPVAGLVLLCLFAANYANVLRRLRRDWRFRRVVIHDSNPGSPALNQFAAEEITRVVVQKGREEAAAQLFVDRRDEPEPLLLFHSHSLPKVTALARSLAERWRVECTLPTLNVDLPANRRVVRIVAYGMLTVALVVGLHGGRAVAKQRAMLRWPPTLATVRHFDPRFEWCREQGCYASPTIAYEYQVDGKTYTSPQLNPDAFHYQSQTEYAADLGDIQVGSVVRCWYNPLDPTEVYIVNSGVTGGTISMLVISGLLLLVAYSSLRSTRRRPSCPS